VLWIVIVVLAGLAFFKYRMDYVRLIIPSALTIIGINIILNTHFYPYILKFQAGSAASQLINEKKIRPEHLYMYKCDDQEVGFCSRHVFTNIDEKMLGDSVLQGKKIWIYTDQENFDNLIKNFKPTCIYPVDYFHVTNLTSAFINPKTRSKSLEKRYLLEL
jgi:hypothetical protein